MNDREFDAVVQLVEECWPGPDVFDQRKRDAWQLMLGHHEAADVAAAVHRLVQTGDHWRPSVAEVAAAINADPGFPSWDEVYEVIYGRGRVTRAPTDEEAIARAAEAHEAIGLFVRAKGLRALQLLPINDPVYGQLRQRELRENWEQHVDRYQERRREGRVMAALGRPAHGELQRFDPLAALERPRLELAPGADEEEVA